MPKIAVTLAERKQIADATWHAAAKFALFR